jgi:hypothetical protein
MRAKVTAVVFVAAGLLGTLAVSAPGVTQLANRGHGGADHGRYGDRCVAEREVLVGPVCVTVNDVLSDILTA